MRSARLSRKGEAAEPSLAAPGMRRLVRRFFRARRGSVAIEFGMVLVPFFALLFSIFENGFLLMVDDGLAQANATATRQILIGTVQGDATINSASQYLDKMICNPVAPNTRVLPSYIDCSKIVVDIRALPIGSKFSDLTPSQDFYTNPGTKQFCTGDSGNIVMVRLMYPMPAYFPIVTSTWLAMSGVSDANLATYDGQLSHIVLSTAVFVNEPFAAGNAPKPGC